MTSIDELIKLAGMHPDDIDMPLETEKFKAEMRRGLKAEGEGSLLMLPSYIPASGQIAANEPVIVIDAGGTNLRTALVTLDGRGGMNIEHFKSGPMPGVGTPVTAERFYDEVAKRILPYADRADRVGFCFSYEFKSLPNRDGIAPPLSKEVAIEGIEGSAVGASTERALKRLGAAGARQYTLLNDTTAVMLGGLLSAPQGSYDGFMGLVLGTGMNLCCAVKTGDIAKLGDAKYSGDNMIINTECGGYNGFARGTADVELDATSAKPNTHLFEKMISGAYLGDLTLCTLKMLAENGAFTRETSAALERTASLELREVSSWLDGGESAMDSLISAPDRDGAERAIMLIYERAARCLSVALCAAAELSDCGRAAERPACVCAEGSTFYKSTRLRELINAYNDSFTAAERGRYLKFVAVENATLAGSAAAAMQ